MVGRQKKGSGLWALGGRPERRARSDAPYRGCGNRQDTSVDWRQDAASYGRRDARRYRGLLRGLIYE